MVNFLIENANPPKDNHEPWWMLRNSGGKKDIALTLMVMTWILSCLLAIAGAIKTITWGDYSLEFSSFDVGFATVVLTPIIGLYFGRRWTDANAGVYAVQSLHATNRKQEDGSDLEEPEDEV